MGFWPVVALIVVSAMWGGHAVVGKALESGVAAIPLTVWRFTLGSVIYLPFIHRLFRLRTLPRQLWPFLLIASLCSTVLYPLFYYQSLHFLTPVESLLLVNTSPFFAVFFSFLFLRERIPRLALLGIFVAFLGVVAMVGGQLTGHITLTGILLALIAAAAFAGYSVASRRLFQTLPLFDVLLSTSFIGTLFLWITVPFLTPLPTVFHMLTSLSTHGWMELLYIVVIVSTVAYALYGYGLRRLPSGIASALTFYPQAIFGALIQWVWLGVAPSIMTYVSALFIFGGTIIMRVSEKRATQRL